MAVTACNIWMYVSSLLLTCFLAYGQGQPRPPPGRDSVCPAVNTIPGMKQFRTLAVEKVEFNSTRLIPDMNFTCSGTIVRVRVVGRIVMPERRTRRDRSNDQIEMRSMMLQIWRENVTERGRYHRINDVALPSMCKMNMLKRANRSPIRSDIYMYDCSLPRMADRSNINPPITVESGDVLGIELPPERSTSFKLYSSTEHTLTSFIIEPNRFPCTAELHSGITNNETVAQPLIRIELEVEPDNSVRESTPQFICPTLTSTLTTTSVVINTQSDSDSSADFEGTTYVNVAIGISVVVVVLLIIIIILMVVGLLRKKRRKEGLGVPNNATYPNPMYYNHQKSVKGDHDMQNVVVSASSKSVLDNTLQATGPDYAEIKEEPSTEKSSEKLQGEEKSVELTKSSNNHYFTLMPQEEQESTSNSVNQAANYEVYIPSSRQCNDDLYDEDSTYWEPADSINELYEQLMSMKYREIFPTNVKLTGVLGSGEFGTVNQGVWESPKGAMDVAVKQLQPGASEEEKVKFLQEAAINGQFRHPNIVKLMGVVTTGEPTMIVLELLSKGDLRTFLKQQPPTDESQNSSADQQSLLLRFCQQVASGMEYLSKKGFVHRDLAARNILVSKDQICKISDFGMSRNLIDESYYISRGGKIPVKWTAPEAIHYKKYSSASDVWSFGCVMYEIWSLGHKPYENHTNPEVIKMVDKGHRLPPPPGLTKELYKIMIQCWQPERSRRPTFSQLVEMLSRADFELFAWEEEDLKGCDHRVKVIGAPLELAQNLYIDLQNAYK